eukprot:GHUV01013067.1.p1 GENE.GHUV01013067.1~~GHUV01013067.1.p1  ORF type:complete len:679 (+),score=139.93 GHUV01013067.1:231-2267(+)
MAAQRHHGAAEATNTLQLPEGVLEHLLTTSSQRQLARLAAVCKDWNEAVTQARTRLSVNVKSDAGTSSISRWLQRYACQLKQLEIGHVGTYGRSCHPDTRLQLFQSLHAACGSTAAGTVAAHAADRSDRDSEVEHPSSTAAAVDNTNHDSSRHGIPSSSTAASAEVVDSHTAPAGPSSAQLQQQPQQLNQQPHTGTRIPANAASAARYNSSNPEPLQLAHLAANMRLAPADCAAIASLPAPHLTSLQLLGSRTRRLAIDGVKSLLQLQQLSSLTVSRFGIGDDATVLLARGLPRLRVLCLSGNNIGPVGAAAVGEHLSGLQQLDMSINRIKDAGLVALCALTNLQTLNLHGNVRFSPSALQSLSQLKTLSSIQLGSNTICNQGLAAIAAALPQLASLDLSNNKIHKTDALTGFVQLTSLALSRNPLQLGCAKVVAGLVGLQELVMFDAVAAKSVVQLTGLAGSLTSLTIGLDPSVNLDDTASPPLAKTRTCTALFGALAVAGKLAVLSVPCCGIDDAGAKALGRFGSCITALNLSYNRLHAGGLKLLRNLPQLRRLELRAMRPELTDDVARVITSHCSKLTLLDLAYNDLSSEGVRQLGCGALSDLQHLNLRNNVQVEKPAIVAAATGLLALTYLNLLELSDVTSRMVKGAASHVDIWAALPNLQELVVGSYESTVAF